MSGFIRTVRAQWGLFAMAWLAVAAVAVVLAGEWARRDSGAWAGRQASAAATLHAAVLRSELERHASLPLVLAQDPDVRNLLTAPTPARVDLLNRKFETLAHEVRAAVIYVLDVDGQTIAASNWRRSDSFVGINYRFRPYHVEALADGRAEFFALGTVSGRPGLYLSRRLDDASGRPLGVVVAKVEFDALETEWRGSGEPAFVTDADGVVLVTTVPGWRFRTTRPLTPERRRRLAVDQTAGAAVLNDMPFRAEPGQLLELAEGAPPNLYAVAQDRTAGLGWTVTLLSPAGQAIHQAINAARGLALLSVALLAGLTGVLLRRRQRALSREAEAEASRLELERRIDQRTSELRETNALLNAEIDERRRVEESRQALQDDLIQATKLATLGQIAAGVAHEINQPIAAIRTHAATAGVHLDRDDPASAGRSLERITELTQRVGGITDELRAFSRKTRSKPAPVEVEAAIEGALLLAGPRLKERGVTLTRSATAPGLTVMAERNRLEQVILNLIQNAIEALDGTAGATADIAVASEADSVRVIVSDNGPGVSDEVRERLFTPFTTDKTDGLGLGLVISRDIVAGFGGSLTLEPSTTGATFLIDLKRAP